MFPFSYTPANMDKRAVADFAPTGLLTFILEKSKLTPLCGVMVWPSSEVPPPNGTSGTLSAAQALTIWDTSSVDLVHT